MSTITSLFIWQNIVRLTRNGRRIQTMNYEVCAELEKAPFFINLDLIFKLKKRINYISSHDEEEF